MAIRERRGGYEVLVYAGLDPLTGKQRYKSRQVNGSRRDAEKEEARLITEVADGKHLGTRAKTFGDLLDLWLPWRERNGNAISPRTVNHDRTLAWSAAATPASPMATGTARLTRDTQLTYIIPLGHRGRPARLRPRLPRPWIPSARTSPPAATSCARPRTSSTAPSDSNGRAPIVQSWRKDSRRPR